jgi:hypothetical protein
MSCYLPRLLFSVQAKGGGYTSVGQFFEFLKNRRFQLFHSIFCKKEEENKYGHKLYYFLKYQNKFKINFSKKNNL